jgi:aminoglycoside 6'-N-acetyltransferase I
VLIRSVRLGDAQRWAMLRRKLWPTADPGQLTAEAESFLKGSTTPTIAAAFLAEEGATPVGLIELAVRSFSDGCESMPVPHVEGWYVEPPLRGKGVGRALMQSAEHWARGLGFSELASDTEIDNRRSLAAHTRCGFLEVERLIKLRKPLA